MQCLSGSSVLTHHLSHLAATDGRQNGENNKQQQQKTFNVSLLEDIL